MANFAGRSFCNQLTFDRCGRALLPFLPFGTSATPAKSSPSRAGLFPNNDEIVSCNAFVASWSILTGDSDSLLLLLLTFLSDFMGDGDLDEGTRVRGSPSSPATIERAGVHIEDGGGMNEAERLRIPCTTPKDLVSGGSGCGKMVVGCRSSSLGFSTHG